MIIEVWSDFVCPYCFVGKRRLDAALALISEAETKADIDVHFRTFRLDAHRDNYDGINLRDSLMANGYESAKVEKILTVTAALGRDDGLEFNLDAVKPTNSTDAHRLGQFIRTISAVAESDYMNRVFLAYFIEGKVISDYDVLVELAVAAGIDESQARTILNDRAAYLDIIREDEKDAYEVYFDVVPHFLFDRKTALSAVHPVEVYRNTIMRALQNEEVG
ncbi:MAG: DsbA family oxidoreductase [Eubacteriales bacterium]|nr:DsbA family oxidoreductase [Eubacteriales bacterium]